MSETHDTICALSTSLGGALAIVRLSGKDAIPIADSLFKGRSSLRSAKSHTLQVGQLVDKQQSALDEIVVSVFHEGRSFTGEDMVEFSCHGSSYIAQHLLHLLQQNACRLADAGEFTKRAFLNGRIDLTQAEAVADLIASTTTEQHRIAMHQLKGGFSKTLSALGEDLLRLASLLELEIDFSEEDIDFANRDELLETLSTALELLSKLIDGFAQANAIKEGVNVAIVGKPNVGKSSLFNLLVEEEKAIVTDLPGTTRDYLEDIVQLNGVQFRFIDTAGLRETSDHVEQIGVERTKVKIKEADIALYLFDLSEETHETMKATKAAFAMSAEMESKMIWIGNKVDVVDNEIMPPFLTKISVKQCRGIEELKAKIFAPYMSHSEHEHTAVANARHHHHLSAIQQELETVQVGIQQKSLTNDMLALHLRYALNHIGELTGTVHSEDILSNIFGEFCIGK